MSGWMNDWWNIGRNGKRENFEAFARGIVVSYFHYNFEITLNGWNELKNLGIEFTHLYFFSLNVILNATVVTF